MIKLATLITILVFLARCNDSKSTDTNAVTSQTTTDESTTGALQIEADESNPIELSAKEQKSMLMPTVDMEVNFGSLAVPSSLRLACVSGSSSDSRLNAAGDDCDGDGGIVAFQTPSTYDIAFKQLTLILADGSEVEVLNFENLSKIDKTGIFSFTPSSNKVSLSVNPKSLTAPITSLKAVIYYYDLTLKIYGENRKIRIYLSDDDFASEGSRGHHQGDITYFDTDGVEHWANGGDNWFSSPSTTTTRGEYANGAGGTDPETGHKRGMFGDANYWNESRFKQGSGQDHFVETFEVSGKGAAYTFVFDISNTWFYEDFERTTTGSFDPCLNSSQEACGGEWSPVFPTVSLTRAAFDEALPANAPVIEISQQHYTVISGEAATIEATVTNPLETDLTIEAGTLPDGVTATVDGGTITFGWTPTSDQVKDTPYLLPIIAGNGTYSVVRAVAVKVSNRP